MGLIVHLSDLHLGPRGADGFDDDDKAHILSDTERQKVRSTAEKEFKKLAQKLRLEGRAISAIIISGDITVQGHEDGFKQLKSFLNSSFGNLLPANDRIVIVPGNHDVRWYAQDTVARYENFIRYCVDEGFVTPPLEDIDLKDSVPWTATEKHLLVDKDEKWAIVPINSAHWSGTKAFFTDPADAKGKTRLTAEAVEARLKAKVAGDDHLEKLLGQVIRASAYDMARVSARQLDAAQKLTELARKIIGQSNYPLVMSTIHHQLLPVTDREEIKPFEAMSNLGAVRTLLVESGVDIVFHGHKHASKVYWDVRELGNSNNQHAVDRSETLVISGGTVGGQPAQTERFANIVEIRQGARGHDVSLFTLGEFLNESAPSTRASFFEGHRITSADLEGATIAEETFDAAYARLLRHANALGESLKNLVVRVAQGSSFGGGPPAEYPMDAAGSNGQVDEWFKEVAEWWQRELEGAPEHIFTHGHRLKRYSGRVGANQIKRMAEILNNSRQSTNGRAMAVIVNPVTDLLPVDGARPTGFPAFSLVQLHLSRIGDRHLLNSVGYFRKQEMRYWWPVNIAELHAIMSEVAQLLKKVELGTITTVAGVAVWEDNRTRVAVPYIDRLYMSGEKGREQIMRAAVDLCTGVRKGKSAAAIRKDWNRLLADVVPDPATSPENLPLSIEGIRFLVSALSAQVVAIDPAAKQRADRLIKTLKSLLAHSKALEGIARTPNATGDPHATVTTMGQDVDSIKLILEDLLTTRSEGRS